jgi:ubiquinone/menaquinone biosynthesis C-methylase UbiE
MSEEGEVLPVTRSKDLARASYDRLSRFYDLLSGSSEKKSIEAGLAMLSAAEGESVLEIGFGTGEALVSLARSVGSSGRVCGTDISPGMSRIATKKLEKSGASARVDLKTADATGPGSCPSAGACSSTAGAFAWSPCPTWAGTASR